MQHFTLNQKSKIKKREERRRRERRRREEEYRRRIERLRCQIEEARKRRQRMLLLFLLAILSMQEAILATFQCSYVDCLDPDPEPLDWTPDPAADFAPRHGSDDHCDGYSREQWDRMLDERGIKVSRKAELKAAWEGDPDWQRFPARYQQWGYRPFLGEILNDLREDRWRFDALAALKLSSPVEIHRYIDEAFYLNPSDLRQCFAPRDHEIVAALKLRATLWDECQRRDIENTRSNKDFRKEMDDDPEGPSVS